MRFELPFNLEIDIASLSGQLWSVFNWGPEQGFRRCIADGLNQKLSPVCGVGYENDKRDG